MNDNYQPPPFAELHGKNPTIVHASANLKSGARLKAK